MLFDTHTHYDDRKFTEDRYEILEDLKNHDVTYALNAGCDLKTSQMSIFLAEKYDFLYASVGFHPHSASEFKDSDLSILENMASHNKVKAIGEIGLDFFYDNSPRDIQKDVFKKQIDLAVRLNMPVVIHDRDAHKECLDIIKTNPPKKLVYHCYSGSLEYAKILIKMGYKMSFGGAITFNNAKVSRDVIKNIPMDCIMLETDCPYLTPVPHRGKKNDSRYINLVAEKIAEIKGISYEEVCSITMQNAKDFFEITE